jgi:uncharacterized RmlC-like cupin family protein
MSETDLGRLLTGIDPELHDGVYVFATAASLDGIEPVASFREREGLTVILRREEAERARLDAAFPCAWITLRVQSSLSAVGFLARVTAALANAGIGCNPVSAFHHDHLFVPHDRAQEALALLRREAELAAGATCVVVHGGSAFAGRQGLDYFEGVSAESAGARGLCMHLLEMPPGAAALPHLHERHETAIHVLSGRASMRYGEGLAERLEVEAGDFLYIPAGVPHLPANASDTEPCTAVLARTDPNEQESVVLLTDGDDQQG